MTPNIPIIAWDPDGDPTRPGVLTAVQNMVPTRRGYASEYSLAASTQFIASLAGECFGAAHLYFDNGTVQPFFATATDLYWVYLGAGGAVNVSRASPAYGAATKSFPWHFASFRNVALAVNYAEPLQATTNYVTTDFADVSGAPKAGTIAVNRNFVVLGAINDGVQKDDGWACSALEDYTDWTPDIATQAATGRLTATPGRIIRMVAFKDYIIAFKETSMYRGQYVGAASNTWAWPVIDTNIGIVSPYAVCEAEGVLYWASYSGFYRYAGGAVDRIRSAPWEWLMANVGGTGFLSLNTQAVWDGANRVVRWVIDTADQSRYCLTYHPDTDRWGRSLLFSNWVLSAANEEVPGVDSADANSRRSAPLFVSSDPATPWQLQTLSGTDGTSQFETGDIGDDDDAFVMTGVRARFLKAPSTSMVTHYYRQNLGDALTTGVSVSRFDGRYDISHSARWHRLRFVQAGRYEIAGFRVDMPRAGKR